MARSRRRETFYQMTIDEAINQLIDDAPLFDDGPSSASLALEAPVGPRCRIDFCAASVLAGGLRCRAGHYQYERSPDMEVDAPASVVVEAARRRRLVS